VEQRSPAAYVAEFIGTFVLVLSITLAVSLFINAQGTGSDWALVGLVHFLVLFVLVQTLGSVSGGHVTPADTVALAVRRKIKPNDAAVYILRQLAGGVAGALARRVVWAGRVEVVPTGGRPLSVREEFARRRAQ
jgi:glycerol uptake facilitator-like aquaporin